ncbi:hypothetical protein [Neobacillus sp. 114]|uniref:hypothetical protein n=1 Tax=Neobacillus sp. 114 TaxID=3048535 RepID=UPI0024C21E0E|nr:hypothetical protein [Neobacillus sp. 114]
MLGYQFKQSYKEQVKQFRMSKQKQKEKRKLENAQMDEDFGDEMFYFIEGYTENGVPFGITREEMEEDEGNYYLDKSAERKVIHQQDDDDLPF